MCQGAGRHLDAFLEDLRHALLPALAGGGGWREALRSDGCFITINEHGELEGDLGGEGVEFFLGTG